MEGAIHQEKTVVFVLASYSKFGDETDRRKYLEDNLAENPELIKYFFHTIDELKAILVEIDKLQAAVAVEDKRLQAAVAVEDKRLQNAIAVEKEKRKTGQL